MEFNDIFNPLKKCLSDGHNRQYFFRDLMAMITTVSEDEWGTPLDPNTKRTKDNTIFSFIKRGLSQTFAQSIVNRLTPETLSERIDDRPLRTREALAKELSIFDSDINADNVGIKAAEMMVKVISKSAGLMSDDEIAAKKIAVIEKSEQNSNTTKKASNDNIDTLETTESDELLARKFLITHENEKELIPLCQLALLCNPKHKHIRSMYTEYLLLPKSVQRLILKSCEIEILFNIESLHIREAIDYFCNDLEKYELSSKQYLYMFSQYLYRAFDYYPEYNIKIYDNNSFKKYIKQGLNAFNDMRPSSIDAYIDDYLWTKENKSNSETEMLPPMDYLWFEKNFGSCNEEDLTYWLCRFVIDSCKNLFHRVKTCDFNFVTIYDQYAETQEDLYYCVLNALYNHYLCHTQNKND